MALTIEHYFVLTVKTVYSCNVLYNFAFLFAGAYVEAQSITLSTNPTLPPERFVSTNYVDLQLIASIVGSPIACDFQRDGQGAVNFYGNGCIDDVSNSDYSTDCVEDENSVTFIYTILSPLSSQLDYVVNCFVPAQTLAKITIQVKGMNQRWSPRGHPWPPGHLLKSTASKVKSLAWPRGLKSSKICLSLARGQHYFLNC